MSSVWENVPLGTIVASLDAGVSVNGEDQAVADASEIGVLKVSCVGSGRFLPEENKKVVSDEVSRVAISPRRGDIIVSRANTIDLVGASGYVEADCPNLFLSDKLWRVRLREPDFDSPRWLIALLNSHRLRREFYRRATGTSGSMKNIAKESLLTIPVPRPRREVQLRLGLIFEAFERTLGEFGKAIDRKHDYKRGLMQQVIAGQTRFPEFRNRPWTKRRFDTLCEEVSERNGKSFGPADVMGVIKGVGFEPMRDRVRGKSDLSRYKIVPPGAFAYNPMRLNIGSIAYNTLGRPIVVSPDYEVFRARGGISNSDYIDQLRYSGYWTSFMKRAGAGSVRVRIYFSDLGRLVVPAPEGDEQTRIAETLRLVDREIALLVAQREKFKEYKRGLLSRLLSGELQVPP